MYFLKLQRFAYKNWSTKLGFQPETIPSHLELLDIDILADEFCEFGKLPIESIDSLYVQMLGKPNNFPEFCTATNHLFKDIESSKSTFVDLGSNNCVEAGGLEWQNIKKLQLHDIAIDVLFDMLNSLPQITRVRVEKLFCEDAVGSLRLYPGYSRLEYLYVRRIDEYGDETAVRHIVEMLKSLECIRKLEIKTF